MIQFKDLVILSRKAPKNGVNLSFENDLNFVEYSKKYEFEFLKLKNQSSDSGSFIVNNVTFFPEDDKEHSLLYLSINSQVFVLSLTLVANTKDKKESMESLQKELLTLKDMPLTNDEEKTKKINSILDIIVKYPLGYVLVDQNNEINIKNRELISLSLEAYRYKATFVVLEREPVKYSDSVNKEKVESFVDEFDSKLSLKNVFSKKSLKFYGHILKSEFLLLSLITLEVAFAVFLANLVPYYFTINIFWGVLLTVVLILMLFIDFLYISTSANFLDKPNPLNEKRYWTLVTYMILFSLVGVGVAYGVFFAFAFNNIIINMEKYNYSLIILSVIISTFALVLPLFAKQLHQFSNFIVSKFKNASKK